MKGLKSLLICALAVTGAVSLTSCGDTTSDFKVGVILVGDESEGYSEAHIEGVKAAQEALGLKDDQILYKKKIGEDNTCLTSAQELVSNGCSLVISNSYGHQDFIYQAATQYKDVTFVSDTGDYAALTGLDNFKNAFTDIYQSRYVSGIVGGLKLKELIDGNKLSASNKDTSGNYKIGYVGAYKYAEVISGYTAFFLGVQSIVSNVTMEVQFTSSWFDVDKENQAATALVNDGCVIIGQHADSTGAPAACESLLNSGKVCYSVGYNVDMATAAPNAALTSATNNWGAFYKYAFKKAMSGEGKGITTDWAEGYDTDAVGLTALTKNVAAGTQTAVDTAVAAIKAGTLHVFDTSKFKVSGANITSNIVDFACYDYSGTTPTVKFAGEKKETVKTSGSTSYVEESVERSAPYFSLKIDGITWKN